MKAQVIQLQEIKIKSVEIDEEVYYVREKPDYVLGDYMPIEELVKYQAGGVKN